MRTGTTNQHLQTLIAHLKRESYIQETPLWHRIAEDLEKPTRQRRLVNISRIQRHAAQDSIFIVPGKVLGSGSLTQPVTVAAWQFSNAAREQIKAAKGKAISIPELLKINPKGKNITIIG